KSCPRNQNYEESKHESPLPKEGFLALWAWHNTSPNPAPSIRGKWICTQTQSNNPKTTRLHKVSDAPCLEAVLVCANHVYGCCQ
ncbi:hypothetical protein ACQEDT_23650, partial [Agrobacterium pusense]|uniref:hypothetical protein n=1 Tax=Agrobacterium pusense TaxID=648995 RepID=UPI003D0E7AD8